MLMQKIRSKIILVALAIGFGSVSSSAHAFLGDLFPLRFHLFPISRLTRFLSSERTLNGVSLISCLGLGCGTVIFLNPVVAAGLGCGLGLFSLLNSNTIRQILKTAQNTEKELGEHRQEFEKHREETQKNNKAINYNVCVVGKQVTQLQSIEQKHHQEQMNAVGALGKQTSNVEKTVGELGASAAAMSDSLKETVIKVALVLTYIKQLQDCSKKSEQSAEERHLATQKTFEEFQNGVTTLKRDVASVKDEMTDLKATVMQNHQQTQDGITHVAKHLRDKEQLLQNELAATQKKLKEVTETQKRIEENQTKHGKDLTFLVRYTQEKEMHEQDSMPIKKVATAAVADLPTGQTPRVNGQMDSGIPIVVYTPGIDEILE